MEVSGRIGDCESMVDLGRKGLTILPSGSPYRRMIGNLMLRTVLNVSPACVSFGVRLWAYPDSSKDQLNEGRYVAEPPDASIRRRSCESKMHPAF